MPVCSKLLKQYMLLLCEHVMTIMKVACAILTDLGCGESGSHVEKQHVFIQVSEHINKDAGCIMLFPLVRKVLFCVLPNFTS